MGGTPLLPGVNPVRRDEEYLKFGISFDSAEDAAACIEFIAPT